MLQKVKHEARRKFFLSDYGIGPVNKPFDHVKPFFGTTLNRLGRKLYSGHSQTLRPQDFKVLPLAAAYL
jgi:hypothetical protein